MPVVTSDPTVTGATGGRCNPTPVALPVVHVAWAAHTLGGSFLRYEVQRRDERDQEWRAVASITDGAMTDLFDHEARMGGVASTYRARQVRTDGVASEWTTSAAVPVATPSECAAAMVFTTNTDGARAVAAPDLTEGTKPDDRDYEPQAADQVETTGIYGREGLVGFRPLEWRGVSFGRSLLVDALMGSRPRGLVVFDPLRDLCEDPALPYVCVRDSFGDRWLALVSPAKLGVRRGDRHRADVDVIELTRTPHLVTSWNGTLGHPWETLGLGRWGTVAGVARLRGHSGLASLAVQDIGMTDAGVKGRLVGPLSTGNGLAFRVADAQNFLSIETNTAFGTWLLVKTVGGSSTVVASGLGGGAGNVLAARFSGSSSTGGTVVTVFENGVRRGEWTITEPVFDGVTRAGLVYRGATAAPTTGWDDWEAWDPDETPGAPWTVHLGTWRTEGSTLTPFAIDRAGAARTLLTANAGTPDVQLHAKLDAQNFTALILRYIDVDNFLAVRASRTFGAWSVLQRIAGVDTLLADTEFTSAGDGVDIVAQLSGDRLRIRVNGGWVNIAGVQTFTLPGSAAPLAASTHHGVGHLAAFATGDAGVVFRAVQIDPVTNVGRSGAQLTTGPSAVVGSGKWVDTMRATPVVLDGDDLVATMWGINDAILGAAASIISAWRHAHRSLASWWLRVEDHQEGDGTTAYSAGWAAVATTDSNTGTGVRVGSVMGATATISVPASYTGGVIALRFPGGSTFGGGTPTGTAKVAVDGGPVTTWPTNVWTTTGAFVTMTTLRIPTLTPGAHTIVVEVDNTVGSLVFDGWHVEQDAASVAPRIRLGNVPRIVQSPEFANATTWSAFTIGDAAAAWVPDEHVGSTVRIYSGTGATQVRTIVANTETVLTVSAAWTTMPDNTSDFIVPQPGSPWGAITDADAATYNAALAEVVAEFPRGVVELVDLDAALAKTPALFAGDELHPNGPGCRAIAAAVQDTLGTWRPGRLWVAGHSYSVGVGAPIARGVDDMLRRQLTTPLVLDGFDRPRSDRYRDSFTR